MEGRRALAFPRTDAHSLREQAARTVLRNVRLQGHSYVELREDNRKFIFFCTLCLSPCYGDSVLFDHLRGNLHNERLATAKVTLLGPNPWPFNDGVLFFARSAEEDKPMDIAYGARNGSLELNKNENLAIVPYDENSKLATNGHDGLHNAHPGGEVSTCLESLDGDGGDGYLLIPDVLVKDGICDLHAKLVGVGRIAARFLEKDEVLNGISRIWCEWLGKEIPVDDDPLQIPKHDFAIVTLGYNYDLGRKGLFGDVKTLLSSSPLLALEDGGNNDRKRKPSFSDPEDISDSLSNQYDSSGEGSAASNGSSPRLLLDRYDDQLLRARITSSKAVRRELRRHQRIAAERMCEICQQKMLPGKDVATLINMKTGKLACSGRNLNGAYHVFHTSCLIHWVLLCEFEIATGQLENPKAKRRSRRKNGPKCTKSREDGDKKAAPAQIHSVFCPECQGTGIMVEGDNLENPSVPLSEMFRFKIKGSDARRAWMKSPERLQNCSVGFYFPQDSERQVEEKVMPPEVAAFLWSR
ncbi:hypothetical protein NL676_017469 [Syzygium grande]|nr:hypothetical protein NL676_017469 [Syzygium grande]